MMTPRVQATLREMWNCPTLPAFGVEWSYSTGLRQDESALIERTSQRNRLQFLHEIGAGGSHWEAKVSVVFVFTF